MRKILVTDALIYANGPVHLGHLLGYLQTDMWVRFQKMRGHECYFICGSDTHGTPIMLKAEELKQAPEVMVAEIAQQQLNDFQAFGIEFDSFELTNSPENQALSNQLYETLKNRGDIIIRPVQQAYDVVKQMFLPDRYVKGTCPACGAENQYSDSCEVCGSTYEGLGGVKNPVSVLSGQPPIYKTSDHYFFDLPRYEAFLKEWSAHHVSSLVSNKLKEWFASGLQAWDISRDAPYYGFEIPGAPGKYFYVWLDAPVGYLASFQKFCERSGVSFEEYWKPDSTTELHHFIGKDIMYFHALFWPAMLKGGGYRSPTFVHTHGFLTIQGQKMSKSRKTFITARQYLDQGLNPEYLRYYLASKLGRGLDDVDLNFEDFRLRVNADLVGKVVNLASRCAGFIHKRFEGRLADHLVEPELFENCVKSSETIADYYEQGDYNKAIREIMSFADRANQFIEHYKPWDLAKQPGQEAQLQAVCTTGLNLFYQLMIYLKPVLPKMSAAAEHFLNASDLSWADLQKPLLSQVIRPFVPLMVRVEAEQLNALGQPVGTV